MSSGEWLAHLNQFTTNRPPDDWLRRHESALRTDIAHDLYYAPELRNAFELLVKLVHIFVVEFFHPAEWESILVDALLQAQELQDRPTMVRVYAELGAAYYAMGRNKRALNAFEIALERARTHEFEKMELAAYIGLIRIQATNLSADFEPDLFARALERSQQGAHDETKAALYHALALVHINRWQLTEGLNWARRAFYLWRTLGDDMETAKTCYLLAVGNRMGRKFDRARYWIKRAQKYFVYTSYELQDVLVETEQGTIFYDENRFLEAEKHLTKALSEAEVLQAELAFPAIYYELAAVFIEIGRYSEAEEYFERAKHGWIQQGNKLELVKLFIGQAYLQINQNNHGLASQTLTTAEEYCRELTISPQRDQLMSYISEFRSKIR